MSSRASITLAVALSFVSCATQKAVFITPSVSTSVTERVEYIHDTTFVDVPFIKEVNSTRDTSSTIENEWAKSSASVSNGTLTHSLETKPQKRPVEYRKEIVYRDSVRTEEVVVEKEVEKELTWWEATKIKFGGWAVLVLVVGVVLVFVVKR